MLDGDCHERSSDFIRNQAQEPAAISSIFTSYIFDIDDQIVSIWTFLAKVIHRKTICTPSSFHSGLDYYNLTTRDFQPDWTQATAFPHS